MFLELVIFPKLTQKKDKKIKNKFDYQMLIFQMNGNFCWIQFAYY